MEALITGFGGMRRILIPLFTFAFSMLIFNTALAWDNHFYLSYVAFSNDPEISHQPTVTAESLSSFLRKERRPLAKLLVKNEKWSEKHIAYYPALPRSLQFTGKRKGSLKKQFLEAIRVNPTTPLPVFIQVLPSAIHSSSLPRLPLSAVMVSQLADHASDDMKALVLQAVKPGAKLSPFAVLTTATDEPDYGLDINLWQNNGTWFGMLYGWGNQPFGNPQQAASSQAPFHMGFYFESPLLYKLLPSLHHCYPEYRIHLYLTLSRFAFRHGHPYWGYRFLGWAIHYVQDLTQPYHASLAPNTAASELITVSLLNYVYISAPRDHVLELITNRHLALENYQFYLMNYYLSRKQFNNSVVQALSDSALDSNYPAYSSNYPRQVVAKQAFACAKAVNQQVINTFPKKYVIDPDYVFYAKDPGVNLFTIMQTKPKRKRRAFDATLTQLFHHVGSHSRNVARFILSKS